MTLRSSRVNDLADAAQAVARVNHYLVGIVDVHDFTLDEFQEANVVLIDIELKALRKNDYASANRRKILDLAFHVLDAACFALHHVHLTH